KKTIGKDWLLWLIYLSSLIATVATQSEVVVLFFVAGILVWLFRTPPRFLRQPQTVSGLFALPFAVALPEAATSDVDLLWRIAWFFTKAGAFVFGRGLAIVPFLYGGVVKEYTWLNDQQFLDAVAVAMITPGPVVIAGGFIGFLIGGFSAASIACLAAFLPCYLLTIIPAPYFKKHGGRPGIVAF